MRHIKLLSSIILLISLSFTSVKSEIIKKIEISGNNRISSETILLFSEVDVSDEINNDEINDILKNVYDSNFFKDVSVSLKNNILSIVVDEKPLIMNITYQGIKSKELRNTISENRILRPRSSYDEFSLKSDKNEINNVLKNKGYYFSKIESSLEILDNNNINIIYKVDLGKKSKIKKITFIGDKIFKDNKLRSLIISEEYKFWKFISGRKFLNEDIIKFDQNLLKNFYLNKGYRNVLINSSFAKLINDNEFELIFNINANEKIFFNKIDIDIPDDYNKDYYTEIFNFFDKFINEPYSINKIEKIVNKIELIALNEQFEAVKVQVEETINDNLLDIKFKIENSEKFLVQRINIFGNNITQESVIRNKLKFDEGDQFNEILYTKSINEIKSLNFFKNVSGEIIDISENEKIINITVQEKATGEISLGAGAGTNGATIGFGINENNFLGKGIKLSSSLNLSEDAVKGHFTVENPSFQNTDKSIRFSIQALEIDRSTEFGYKTNKIGFSTGTSFEYLKDFKLGLDVENFYEKITADASASTLQKTQEGNYWDTFLNMNFDYDKRNQKYETSDGFRNIYSLKLPIISETNTLTNYMSYRAFSELYENNISSAGLTLKAVSSITGDNIKLSERVFVPGSKLRGFENGKIGPKDGDDFVGGNYMIATNFKTSLPQLFPNQENINFLLFLDAASLWGVDYSSSIEDVSSIRSSVGLGVDWFTTVGPLNFSLSQAITKESTDITESFRFNLGTTF